MQLVYLLFLFLFISCNGNNKMKLLKKNLKRKSSETFWAEIVDDVVSLVYVDASFVLVLLITTISSFTVKEQK